MASKRKSTTPCMIPSKIVRTPEDLRQDSPLLLHQSRVSGAERNSPLNPGESSKAEMVADAAKDGAGIYTCKPCNFETHDLNLFLDHVYSGHPDFRADPSFFCVSCGFSAPKFEGLALHNARIHPSTLNTTLHLRRKERRVVVEQNLLAAAETSKESEISITKTPIMRMLKGKSELKRIVVSHAIAEETPSDPNLVPASRDTERKENNVVTVSHVPTITNNGTTKVTLPPAIQIVNGSGALPLLKTPITQVVSVVQNRNLQHSAPITVSSNISSASSSSKNLPKVMIPLSSIPTYSASMDSSSFLKTSFSKFPYPTKAELCYLTVVTKFPEEQIKIWFTAQRLKQGISWSPEEIEEARRKMFNTIIQTAPASSQSHTPTHHSPAQHTITVLPASLGAAGIPHILQGSLVSQGGVIVTQPVMTNGIQVSSAPVALAVTPKPQGAARPMMQARPAAALVADKGLSMMVGAVGSSSQGSYVISSSKSSTSSSNINNSQASVINLSLGNGNHTNSKGSSVNGKHTSNSSVSPNNKSKSNSGSQVKASKTPSSSSKTSKASMLKSETKTAVESKVSIEGKNNSSAQKNKDSNTSSGASSPTTDLQDSSVRNSPAIKLEEAPSPLSKSSSSSPAPPPGSTSSSQTPFNTVLDTTFYKGKKSPEQLNTLKDSFLVNQFPDQEEVERLIGLTGLTVREVRKWFSDRRYHFRNQKGARSTSAGLNKTTSGTGSSSNTSGNTSNTLGSTSGILGHGATGSADPAPIDLSESSRAKTPQQSSDARSPTAVPTPASPTTPSRRLPRVPSPDFTAVRYKEREPHQLRALETSFSLDPDPPGEEVDRLRTQTKMTRREIHSWFSEKRKRVAAEKKREEAERALREEEEQGNEAEVDGEEKQREDGSGEPKVNPIKINLKMLKVTEANGKAEGDGAESLSSAATPSSSPGSSSSTPKLPSQSSTPTPNKSSHSSKPATVRGKKTAEQLHLLKQVYARTQWPSATQYDQLITATALPRPEVVRWFGDCRYVQKNGQLKWLEAYQSAAQEEDLQKGDTQKLQEHLAKHGRLDESQLAVLCESSGLTEDVVRAWFSSKASPLGTQPPADQVATETTLDTPSVPAEPMPTSGSSPPQPQPGEGTEERMEPSVCGSENNNNKEDVSDGDGAEREGDTETTGGDTKGEAD